MQGGSEAVLPSVTIGWETSGIAMWEFLLSYGEVKSLAFLVPKKINWREEKKKEKGAQAQHSEESKE